MIYLLIDWPLYSWVEVWTGAKDGWRFVEGWPAGPGETLDNPCDKWFCNPAHFNNSGTRVYAATYQSTDTHYPLAWDLSNQDVPGVDRTDYYEQVCSAC